MRLLALSEAADHVCCRYRIRAFEPALAAAGCSLTIRGVGRGLAERLARLRSARDFDAVILQRKLLPGWQLRLLRRYASRLLFDFDDAVLFRDSYDPRGVLCPERLRRFRRTVSAADAIIAGNSYLAGCAVEVGKAAGPVVVIPTCVDPASYPGPGIDRGDDRIILAWIGSSSTLKGLEAQRTIWERVGRAIPDATLRLISDRFAEFPPLRVERVPWSESTEALELSRADAGVSWMPDDLWSRGKCGLKLLQYQAAGLPAIANPVGVHGEILREGETGFLAETPDDWLRSIRLLASDPSMARAIGRAARRSVESRYSVDVWAPIFVRTATGRVPPPPPSPSWIGRDASTRKPSRRHLDDSPAG